MYPNEITIRQSASLMQAADYNPTVGENLDNRIANLKAELARLEASKETLGPLLNMRIRDIRDAMNY